MKYFLYDGQSELDICKSESQIDYFQNDLPPLRLTIVIRNLVGVYY